MPRRSRFVPQQVAHQITARGNHGQYALSSAEVFKRALAIIEGT